MSSSNKLPAACLIMAGGEGRRLSPDKPLLKINGTPIITRVVDVVTRIFTEILLVTNTPDKYAFLGLHCIPDYKTGCGPLMGIYSGLQKIKADIAFVCGADMPFLEERIIRAEFEEVAGYDMVVPYPNQLPEFLHAYYQVKALPIIENHLNTNRYKIDQLRYSLNAVILDDDWFSRHHFQHLTKKAFANINTPEDYHLWAGA